MSETISRLEMRLTKTLTGHAAIRIGERKQKRMIARCPKCGFFCSVCQQNGKCCLTTVSSGTGTPTPTPSPRPDILTCQSGPTTGAP